MKEKQMGTEVIEQWLAQATENTPLASIARKIGVPQRTFANHVKNGDLEIWEIVSICRKYGCSILDALTDLNVMTDGEAEKAASQFNLSQMPVRDLLAAVGTQLDQLWTVASDERLASNPDNMRWLVEQFLRIYGGSENNYEDSRNYWLTQSIMRHPATAHSDIALSPMPDFPVTLNQEDFEAAANDPGVDVEAEQEGMEEQP